MSAHSITSRGLAGRKIPQGTLTPIGTLLFSGSEPGAWYDPSDMSTLFQDAAGTTPVTAVEQPVGRMLDKSGRGNHATQATTTKRPLYSRRVNELLATTTLATQSVTTRAAAYRLVFSGSGSITLSGTASGVYGAGTHSITCTAGSLTLTVSGTVQDASLTLATDAHLPYQWVNTDTDYDADPAKFPAYLRCDGVDDSMQSIGNIDLSSTSKVMACAGVTKLNDAGSAAVFEHPQTYSGVPDGMAMWAPLTAEANYFITMSPNSNAGAVQAAPSTNIVTGLYDHGGAGALIRVNGVQKSAVVAVPAGQMGNYPLSLFSRGGTSLFFKGRFYGLVLRGAQSSLSQIEATELYIKQKMRMP